MKAMALKHPDDMTPDELDSYINSLDHGELEKMIETYGYLWRAYTSGFQQPKDEQAFIRTGQALQSHYAHRSAATAAV